jgi:hypothetical protein
METPAAVATSLIVTARLTPCRYAPDDADPLRAAAGHDTNMRDVENVYFVEAWWRLGHLRARWF